MAKLIYSAIMSLDGYIADMEGLFDWAEPDEEVHAFVNDLERQVGPISTVAGCMKSWPPGTLSRPTTSLPHCGIRECLARR
jgi:hypothetical protein